MYHKSINIAVRMAIALFLAIAVYIGCKREETGNTEPVNSPNFVTKKNNKFIYRIENDGDAGDSATQSMIGCNKCNENN